ncbi:MAG: OTU domain-containing protein [Chlamydiales bacterium]
MNLSRVAYEIKSDFYNPLVFGYEYRHLAIWYGRQVKHLGHIEQNRSLIAQAVNKVFLAFALLLFTPFALFYTFCGFIVMPIDPLMSPSYRVFQADRVLRETAQKGRIQADHLLAIIHFIQEAREKAEALDNRNRSLINDIERRVNALPGLNNGQGVVVDVPGDGDCLFWAFYYHSYINGRENRASTIEEERRRAIQWEEEHFESSETLSSAITNCCYEWNWPTLNRYFSEMRIPRRYWGDHPELFALSQIHNLEVIVFDRSRNRCQLSSPPGSHQGLIILEYLNQQHYNFYLSEQLETRFQS